MGTIWLFSSFTNTPVLFWFVRIWTAWQYGSPKPDIPTRHMAPTFEISRRYLDGTSQKRYPTRIAPCRYSSMERRSYILSRQLCARIRPAWPAFVSVTVRTVTILCSPESALRSLSAAPCASIYCCNFVRVQTVSLLHDPSRLLERSNLVSWSIMPRHRS